MAGLTLAQARTRVLDFLDDSLGDRYAPGLVDPGSFTKVDLALGNALSKCLGDYVRAGGDQFLEETTVTTSSADGTVSLTSLGPIDVRNVLVNFGATIGKVRPIRRQDRSYPDPTSRSVVVSFVREYDLPTTQTHPLVGVGSTAANTWLTFDTWVCARAALDLLVKDNDLRQTLASLEADQRQSVMDRINLPRSADFPGPLSSMCDDLRWTYLKTSKSLQLVRASW